MTELRRRIRNLVAGLAAAGLMASGRVQQAREETFRAGWITPVLFHNPSAHLFRRCMTWLRDQGYTFIAADEVTAILKGERPPVPGAVWVSFDDGWQANLRNVVPVMRELDIPITFFISTDPVERTGVFWWTQARRYRRLLPPPFDTDTAKLWRVPEAERRAIVESLHQRVGSEPGREAMTVAEVQSLARLPQVTIGSHTVHHAILPTCTPAELEEEIGQSQSILTQWTDKPVRLFAYPNGDHDGRERDLLRSFGYTLAAATERRLARVGDDLYRVPRLCVLDDITFRRGRLQYGRGVAAVRGTIERKKAELAVAPSSWRSIQADACRRGTTPGAYSRVPDDSIAKSPLSLGLPASSR